MKAIMIIVAAVLIPVTLSAQVGIGPAAFNVDFASFASDSGEYNLFEVYYQIYSANLLHVREDGRYMAMYNVTAVVKDGKRQIAADEQEETIYAETYDHANNSRNYIVNKMSFYVKPGKYKVEVTLNDVNASSSIPLETTLELPVFESTRPMFSQIEFARNIENIIEGDTTVFDKTYWRIIPSCSRRYGDGVDWLKFYYELYNGQLIDQDRLSIVYEIRDRRNKVVKAETVVKGNRGFNAYIDSLNLANFKPGDYDLVIYSRGNDDELVSRIGSFTVHWTALELVRNDFNSAIQQLRYIADSKEIDRLKKAPKDQRINEWNRFWKLKDPSPDTELNELKNEYYRRIAYSNRHYTLPNREGWTTDMGMIHVINGKPDDIERHPFDIETKPYEIWYYYNPRRRYLFIDVNGYGEYVLQYPYDGDVNKRINIYGGGP